MLINSENPISSKGVFLLEENYEVIEDMDEDDIRCFIFRTEGSEQIFVRSVVIHKKNDEYDDRKILFDQNLKSLLKKYAQFHEDQLTSTKYSNRPFDISQVEMEIGNKYLVGNFSKIFVNTIQN